MLRNCTHTHKHTYIGYTLEQVHCVAIKWELWRVWSVTFFQPRCRLNEHFSQFLVQPLCCFAFKAAWRRHFGAIQARLLERAEYKRAESSFLENNTAIPRKPPLPSQWPQLSPVTQLCHIHRFSLTDSAASQGGEKWAPDAANSFYTLGVLKVEIQGCLRDSEGPQQGFRQPWGRSNGAWMGLSCS